MPSITTPIFLGLDVHKNTISAAVLRPGEDVPDVEKISSDEEPVRRLIARLGNPRRLRACYEAGPTGYDLCRLLRQLGVACEVIAPSLTPKASGDKVKTDLLTELPEVAGPVRAWPKGRATTLPAGAR